MRLVYLYLSVCICKTKEQDLRVPNGQLNRRSRDFRSAFSGQLTRWMWQSPESQGDAGRDLQRLIEELNLQHPIDAHHLGNTHHSLTAPEESKLERASNLQEPSDQEEFSDQENSSDELDLVACKPVVFEMRQSTPGMQYVKDGEQNWTPLSCKEGEEEER